jgi:hypothetical protein
VKAPAALALILAAGCSRGRDDKHAAAPRAALPDAATAQPALSTAGADISWLVGTWERQTGPKEWLLFNPPKEVAVISGTPPAVSARGEFVPQGRSISIFMRGPGGGTTERILEGSPDHSELHEDAVTYRRGAPP